MKNKYKLIAPIIAVCCIIIGSYAFQINKAKNIPLNFSVSIFDIEDLIQNSDLVAEVKFTKLKEKTIKTVQFEAAEGSEAYENNEKSEVKSPVLIYEAEIIDVIKGEKDLKKVNVIVPDMNINIAGFNIKLDLNSTYLVHLYKNNYYGNNAYSFVSFSQGIHNIDDKMILIEDESLDLENYKNELRLMAGNLANNK